MLTKLEFQLPNMAASLLDVVGIVACAVYVREVAAVVCTCKDASRDDLFSVALTQRGVSNRKIQGPEWHCSTRLAHACLVGDVARVRFLCERGRAWVLGPPHLALLLGFLGGHVAAARTVLEFGQLSPFSYEFVSPLGSLFAMGRAARSEYSFPLSVERIDLLREVLAGADPINSLLFCVEMGVTALIPELIRLGIPTCAARMEDPDLSSCSSITEGAQSPISWLIRFGDNFYERYSELRAA